jgi:hypothetical protein
MPRYVVTAKQEAAKVEALDIVSRGTAQIRRDVKKKLLELDPADPEALVIATVVLLKVDFEQKALAEWVGVSRTTVSRWARKQNIPRSPVFRKWAFDLLVEHLSDPVIVMPAESSQPRSQQAGRSKRLR